MQLQFHRAVEQWNLRFSGTRTRPRTRPKSELQDSENKTKT